MILLINTVKLLIELLKQNLLLRIILILNIMKIQTKKILNLKLVTMLEFQNIQTFLLKDIVQTGQKKFLLLAQFLGLMLLLN